MIDFVTIYCYNLIMGKKEYVLYTGEKFTVEWYFNLLITSMDLIPNSK